MQPCFRKQKRLFAVVYARRLATFDSLDARSMHFRHLHHHRHSHRPRRAPSSLSSYQFTLTPPAVAGKETDRKDTFNEKRTQSSPVCLSTIAPSPYPVRFRGLKKSFLRTRECTILGSSNFANSSLSKSCFMAQPKMAESPAAYFPWHFMILLHRGGEVTYPEVQ